MWSNHWGTTMKTLSIADLVSGMTMAWKQKYIWDDQWEELCWEFYSCCSLVWKYPVHTAAFLFCVPRLIKILVFFYPLVITTALFFLIIFSLGPQLERMKADRDSQLERFREAVDDGVGGGRWVSQQTYGNLVMAKGVGRSVAWDGANWTGWVKSPRSCPQSIPYTEEKFPNDSQTNDLNTVGFGTVAKEEVGQKEAWSFSSNSIILGKLGDLMEKLIAELGGSVELDVLNALETITQVLIESTGRNYQKMAKITSLFNVESTENELLDAKQFKKSDLVEVCQSLTRSDSVGGTDAETSKHVPRESIETSKEQRDSVAPASSEDSCAAETPDTSKDMENGNAPLDGDRVPPYEPPDGVGLPVQDKLQKADGVFRSCRSFPLGALDGEYGNMDELWKRGETCGKQRTPVGEEKDWKATLADRFNEDKQEHWRTRVGEKFYEKQTETKWKFQGQFSSRSLVIPRHENRQCHMMAGKLRNSPLEPMTFVKKPQFLTSPVMLMEAQDMDLLWEEYNDAPGKESEPLIKDCSANAGKHRHPAETEDSDAEEDSEIPQVCCLKALKFSKHKLPLKKPNFMKISKALKKLGLVQHFRDRKQSKC